MTEFDSSAPIVPAPHQPMTSAGVPPEQIEIVARGVLWSLAAIPVGMAAAVLIWKLGFIASITSFLIAGLGTWLYTKGALSTPRRGLVPLVGVILLGVALSFLAIVAADIVEFYGTPEGKSLGYSSAVDMVTDNLFNADLIGSYGSDLAMFLVFAALGVFGTVRRLMGNRRG